MVPRERTREKAREIGREREGRRGRERESRRVGEEREMVFVWVRGRGVRERGAPGAAPSRERARPTRPNPVECVRSLLPNARA